MSNLYSIGTDWNTAAHWSQSDGGAANGWVPTNADDVFITASSIDISLSTTGVCRDITVQANKLSLNSYTLTVDDVVLSGGTVDLGSGTFSYLKNWNNTGTTIVYGTSTVYMRHTAAYYTITPGSGEFYNFDQAASAYNMTLVGNLVTHGKLSIHKPVQGSGVFKPTGDVSSYRTSGVNIYYATTMDIDTNATHTITAEVDGALLPAITINKTGGMTTFVGTFEVAGNNADTGFIITHGRAFTDLSASTMRMMPAHRTISGVTFGNLDLRTGAYDVIIGDDNTVEGLLTLTSMQELKGTGILRAHGDVTQTAGNSIIGTEITQFIIDGDSGDQTVTNLKWGSAGTFEVDKPSGDVIVVGVFVIGNDTTNATLSGNMDIRFQSDIDFTTNDTTCEFTPHNQTIYIRNDFTCHHLSYKCTHQHYVGNLDLDGHIIYVQSWMDYVASSSHHSTIRRQINNGTIKICGDLTLSTDTPDINYRGTTTIYMNGDCDSSISGTGDTGDYWNDIIIQKDITIVDVELIADLGLVGGTITINTGRLKAAHAFRCEDLENHDELWLRTGSEPIVDGTDTKYTDSRVTFYDATVDANINDYATTFNCIRFGSRLKTYYFDAGVKTIINQAICTDGNSLQRAFLRSTVDGTQWELDLQGISALDAGVDVKDSNAVFGNTVNAIGSLVENSVNWNIGTGPPQPTLAITDKEDGTGVYVTVTDGSELATNTIYVRHPVSGSWTILATFIGNKTEFAGLVEGSYISYCYSVVSYGSTTSNLVSFSVTDTGIDPDGGYYRYETTTATSSGTEYITDLNVYNDNMG